MVGKLHPIDLQLNEQYEAQTLFGSQDKHLKLIEEQLDVSIVTRGEAFYVKGTKEAATYVQDVLTVLYELLQQGLTVTGRDVIYAIKLIKSGKKNELQTLFADEITKNFHGESIRIKTLGQKAYVEAIKRHDLVFSIGPAGTGKTFLAVVKAVHALRNGSVKRIILTRPAVEAGESLGFLPGDLKEKVDPYLRPLYDSLHFVLGKEHTARLQEREVIEIAPLAYMRGRTLDDAFVILDEAQNTTPEQMKMFLTRLGFGSKMIITGDITQIDLPKGVTSGLKIAEETLANINGISFIYLDQTDVVRHPLVQKIIEAYEKD
ncbi:MAG TPA: PhoH family protein [Bacillota bacterium]|nr:PhoH family protein [Bacillota bacterium]